MARRALQAERLELRLQACRRTRGDGVHQDQAAAPAQQRMAGQGLASGQQGQAPAKLERQMPVGRSQALCEETVIMNAPRISRSRPGQQNGCRQGGEATQQRTCDHASKLTQPAEQAMTPR